MLFRSVATDASGHFLVEGAPVGQRKMHVAPTGGGAALDVPLTVIGSATIQTGAVAVSRSQAVDLAKAAAASLGTVGSFQILAPQQPLPVGTILKPALGGDDAKDDPALTVTVAAPQWLVFVDTQPGARFQHPAAFVLVDAQTGAVMTKNVSSWPRLNGVSHYADDDKNAAAQDLAQAGTRAVAPPSRLARVASLLKSVPTRDHVPGAVDPKTYALLVDGNSRSDMAADLLNVKEQLFGAGGLSGPNEISTWSPAETVNLSAAAQIRALFDNICKKARPEDTILVYVSSHGSKSGAIYIQQGVESDESVTPDDILFPYIDFNTSKCAACHVIFIIDTCFSGQQMVDMAVKSPPHAGQKLTFIAASTSAETSAGITKANRAVTGKATGGVFTNAFLNALHDFSTANGGAGQGNLQKIFDNSLTIMNSTTQHPQTTFKWDGAACGAPVALIDVTPKEVVAKHTVGTTACPQSLGDLTLKNLTDHAVSYNLGSNSAYFNLSGASGSLSPGQSKSLGLSFNCGKVPPLSAGISISATSGSDSQSLSIPVTLNAGP